MTLASWFSSMRRSRRLTQTGARRNRSRIFRRRASFDALEGRALLLTVSFGTAGESVNESAGTVSIPVTITGTPVALTVSTFASGFSGPDGLAFDAAGNLYVGNDNDGTVSEVTPAGAVSTFASGFDDPDGLAFDAAGNLYVANAGTDTVSEVTPQGVVSTFASGVSGPVGLAFGAAGNLYVANGTLVSEVTPAGKVSTFASGFDGASGLAFDSAGNLFVTNDNNTVSEVTPAGAVRTFASGVSFPDALAFDSAGNLYVANGEVNTVSQVTPAGVVSTFASGFDGPDGLAFDAGSLYVANDLNDTISEVSQTVTVPFTLGESAVTGLPFSGVTASPLTFGIGETTQDITGTLLSDPGPSQVLTVTLGTPTGGTVLGSPSVNTLTITEPEAAEVQFSIGSETVNETAGTFSIPVTVTGTPTVFPTVSNFASGVITPYGLAFNDGNAFVANLSRNTVSEVTPAGAVSTFASGFDGPISLAFDAAGNLFVANVGNNTVSEVTPEGVVSTFASGFNEPDGLAFDADGNLFVANDGHNTVMKVTPAGVISTFASGFEQPDGLAFNSAGNLFVANNDNNTVSEVTPAGAVSTFASGFSFPDALAFDSAGNLYVANANNETVSEVTPAGAVSTFTSGFDVPFGLAVDAGDLYVANANNNTISEVSQTVTVPFTLGGSAVSGVDFSGVTSGTLTFGIGQATQVITGTLLSDPGTSRTLTVTLGTPTGGAVLGSPSVNTLTITEPTSSPVPPLFIGEQRVFSHKGKHKKLVGFEFLFNGALNPGGAQSTGNYRVTQKQGKKVKVLAVQSAIDNPGNFSVTISVGGFKTGKAGQVTITGLAGANGGAIPQITSGL